MPRLPHGLDITPETARDAREAVTQRVADVPLGFAALKPVDLRRFDFLFLELQEDPANLLPVSRRTRDALRDLGLAMADDGTDDPAGDSRISAAYTYFGQFVDHDITLEASSAPGSRLTAGNLEPLPLHRIREDTQNIRTGVLELDSVYGLPAEKDRDDPSRMRSEGSATSAGNPCRSAARRARPTRTTCRGRSATSTSRTTAPP